MQQVWRAIGVTPSATPDTGKSMSTSIVMKDDILKLAVAVGNAPSDSIQHHVDRKSVFLPDTRISFSPAAVTLFSHTLSSLFGNDGSRKPSISVDMQTGAWRRGRHGEYHLTMP